MKKIELNELTDNEQYADTNKDDSQWTDAQSACLCGVQRLTVGAGVPHEAGAVVTCWVLFITSAPIQAGVGVAVIHS